MHYAAYVAALEDKIVQRAVVALLNVIYEEDLLGFSYGFRPGRGASTVASPGFERGGNPTVPIKASLSMFTLA